MIKSKILKIYDFLEFSKIVLLKKIFGMNYIVKSLKSCRKSNIGKILSYYGANIGNNIHFKGHLSIDNYSSDKGFFNLYIDDNCYIGSEVYFDLANMIKIERDVVIGARATITTHSDVGDRKMNIFYKRISSSVTIKEGAWLGVNSVILTGVVINRFSIVGAGSIVLKDTNEYTMVAGNPATFKKDIK